MSRRRWVCPKGCGNNLLAPGRMRRDDVRRYCLPCSEQDGRLVERTCPALEREREEKAGARKTREKAARKRERERNAHLDLAAKIRRKAARLSTWRREGVKMQTKWLRLKETSQRHPSGFAGYWGHVKVPRDPDHVSLAVVIVHEFAHVCCFRGGMDDGHGQNFRGVYLSAVCEFFGLDYREVVAEWDKVKGMSSIQAYDLDRAVRRVVRKRDPNWRADA